MVERDRRAPRGLVNRFDYSLVTGHYFPAHAGIA